MQGGPEKKEYMVSFEETYFFVDVSLDMRVSALK